MNNSAPESEVRLLINDIKSFRDFLNSKKVIQMKRYRLTDHFYRPSRSNGWKLKDLENKTMRIREWKEPEKKSQLLYSKVEILQEKGFQFKRSIFAGGKLTIFEFDRKIIEDILSDWNFEFWFKLEKEEGQLLQIPGANFLLALEKISGFGYSAEIEVHVPDARHIQDLFSERLSFFESIKNTFQTTYRSLPSLVGEALGL